MPSLEHIADSFVRDHLRRNPGLEVMSVQCAVDKHQALAANAADVHAFLKTLDQDQSIRFDVDDVGVEDELVHAEPVPEPEIVNIDIDAEPVVLARRRRHHLLYFAGFYKHRSLWTTDPRCAHVFDSEDAVVIEAFQFADDGSVLKEVFLALGLQMLPAPKQPESI